jgi:tetratricopeptide (TPR) repeat protein
MIKSRLLFNIFICVGILYVSGNAGTIGSCLQTASPDPIIVKLKKADINKLSVLRPQPFIPSELKDIRLNEFIEVGVIIDEKGKVISAIVTGVTWQWLEHTSLLAKAALEAAQQWQFKPQKIDGKPARIKGVISFNIRNKLDSSDVDNNSPFYHYNLGEVYLKKDAVAQAVEEYQTAIKLNPNFALAYYRLGCAFYKRLSYGSAREAFQKAINLKTDLDEAYVGLGWSSFPSGGIDESTAAFKKSASLKVSIQSLSRAYQNLSLNYKIGELWEDYVKAQEQNFGLQLQWGDYDPEAPVFPIGDGSWLAAGYTKIGKYEEAIEVYKFLIKYEMATLHTESLSARLKMARLYEKLGKYEEAVQISNELIKILNLQRNFRKIDEYRCDTCKILANSYKQLELLKEAEEAENKALEFCHKTK